MKNWSVEQSEFFVQSYLKKLIERKKLKTGSQGTNSPAAGFPLLGEPTLERYVVCHTLGKCHTKIYEKLKCQTEWIFCSKLVKKADWKKKAKN